MAYLEVKIGTNMEYTKPVAFTANGHDLGESQGCFGSLFLSKPYPRAEDYIRGLEYQGWRLYHADGAISRSAFVMYDGMFMGNASTTRTLIFIGNGRYRVSWEKKSGRWHWYFE